MEHLAEHQRFIENYDDNADAVYRHCYFKLYDKEQATDVMQEAFLRAWEYVVKGKKVDNLRAFVFKIANNRCIDILRKKKESSLDALMEEGFDASLEDGKTIERNTDSGFALRLLKKLNLSSREIMIFRYVDDLSIKEIAEIIGETENGVSVKIHRATAELKKLFPQ